MLPTYRCCYYCPLFIYNTTTFFRPKLAQSLINSCSAALARKFSTTTTIVAIAITFIITTTATTILFFFYFLYVLSF